MFKVLHISQVFEESIGLEASRGGDNRVLNQSTESIYMDYHPSGGD